MKLFGTVRVCVVVAVFVLLAGLPTQADVRKGNGEIGFDFGGTEFDPDLASGAAGRLDVRAGYMITNLFQIEGMVGYSGPDDGDLATAFVNGVFNFHTGPRLMPYFLLGAGGAYIDIDSVDDNGVGGQVAGGFRAFGAEGRIGLRLELGAMALDLFDETTTQWNFTVGFTFALGAHHAHRAPKVKHQFDD